MLERGLAFAELVARQAQLLGTQLERAQLPVHVHKLGSLGKRRPAMAELVDDGVVVLYIEQPGQGPNRCLGRLAPLVGIFSCCHLPPVISCRLCLSSRVVSATTIVPGTAPPADRTRPRVRFGHEGRGSALVPDPGSEAGGTKGPDKGVVGHRRRLVPSEPTRLGALTGRRSRVAIWRDEQIPQVKMGVPVGGAVHVHVDEARPSVGMVQDQPGFFLRFPQGRIPWRLPGVKVAAGLQPPVQALVHVQHRAAGPDHHGRPGDVLGTGVFVEGAVEHVEGNRDACLGAGLTIVAGHVGTELSLDPSDRSWWPPASFHRSPDTLRHVASLPHCDTAPTWTGADARVLLTKDAWVTTPAAAAAPR